MGRGGSLLLGERILFRDVSDGLHHFSGHSTDVQRHQGRGLVAAHIGCSILQRVRLVLSVYLPDFRLFRVRKWMYTCWERPRPEREGGIEEDALAAALVLGLYGNSSCAPRTRKRGIRWWVVRRKAAEK